MEYKTVLARSGDDAAEAGYYGNMRYVQYVVAKESSRTAGRFCRRCSGKNVFVGFVLTFLLLLTGAVVQQQMEIHGLKQDVALISDKVSDMMVAQFLANQQGIEAYTKGEQLFKNKANPEQDRASSSNKRHAPCLPNGMPSFFIRGTEDEPPTDTFLWEYGTTELNRNLATNNFRVDNLTTPYGPKIRGIRIKYSGLYFIFVQLNAAGRRIRRHHYPAVGFTVMKWTSTGTQEKIGTSFVTQDERGAQYMDINNGYPIDSVQFSGLVNLKRDDTITIQRLDHLLNEGPVSMFKHGNTAHFGGFMVTADCE